MTNINCTYDCIYQKNGTCQLDNVTTASQASNSCCPYFISKNQDKKNLQCKNRK